MAPPPFRCPNETKRPKKIFWSLREFWARQHRRALGSCHSTLRLVEKFSRFALNGSITFILLLIALFCFLLLVIGLLCSFALSLLRCFACFLAFTSWLAVYGARSASPDCCRLFPQSFPLLCRLSFEARTECGQLRRVFFLPPFFGRGEWGRLHFSYWTRQDMSRPSCLPFAL